MTAANDKKAAFLSGLAQALEDKTFVKLALGKYRGQGEPRKSVVTLVLLKGLPHLKFVTSYGRKDETKNFALAEGIDHVGSMVGYPYLSATLFTTKRDTTLKAASSPACRVNIARSAISLKSSTGCCRKQRNPKALPYRSSISAPAKAI